MHIAILRAQERIAARIEEMPDVVEGVPVGDPATRRLLERFEAEVARRRIVPAHDTRVVVAALISATAGYALFGRYVGLGVRLGDLSGEQTEAAFVALLQDVARLAFVA